MDAVRVVSLNASTTPNVASSLSGDKQLRGWPCMLCGIYILFLQRIAPTPSLSNPHATITISDDLAWRMNTRHNSSFMWFTSKSVTKTWDMITDSQREKSPIYRPIFPQVEQGLGVIDSFGGTMVCLGAGLASWGLLIGDMFGLAAFGWGLDWPGFSPSSDWLEWYPELWLPGFRPIGSPLR